MYLGSSKYEFFNERLSSFFIRGSTACVYNVPLTQVQNTVNIVPSLRRGSKNIARSTVDATLVAFLCAAK